MLCPVCGIELHPVRYEGVDTGKCEACLGRWIDAEALKAIVSARKVAFDSTVRKKVARRLSRPGVSAKELERGLKCPECNIPTEPRNYGGDTGIIVNRCTACGGIWLDHCELETIQMLVEGIADELAK